MNDWEAFLVKEQVAELNNQAVVEVRHGRYGTAERMLEEACEQAQKLDDLDNLVTVSAHLAGVRKHIGKREESLLIESWLIGLATDTKSNHRIKDERTLRFVAGAFASFTDITRDLPGANLDNLLDVLRRGEAWMGGIGHVDWTADLRIQHGLILNQRGDKLGARREQEAGLALKRRQNPPMGFTFQTHLYQLATLLMNEPFNDYSIALDLTNEMLGRSDCDHFSLLRAYEIRSSCRQWMGDLDGAESEARELVATARQSDQKTEWSKSLMRLGIVQAARKGHSAAAATYREVIALLDEEDDNFTSTANSCAWQLYMACDNLDEAAKLAHRAWQKTPADTNILQTLAAILVRHNQWSEALVHIRDWVGRVDRTDLSSAWNQHVLLFRDALTHGQGENLAGILNGELWEPMRIALVKSSRSDHDLSDVPTGLREAVTALLSQLRGENVPLVYPSFEFGSVLPTG